MTDKMVEFCSEQQVFVSAVFIVWVSNFYMYPLEVALIFLKFGSFAYSILIFGQNFSYVYVHMYLSLMSPSKYVNLAHLHNQYGNQNFSYVSLLEFYQNICKFGSFAYLRWLPK